MNQFHINEKTGELFASSDFSKDFSSFSTCCNYERPGLYPEERDTLLPVEIVFNAFYYKSFRTQRYKHAIASPVTI